MTHGPASRPPVPDSPDPAAAASGAASFAVLGPLEIRAGTGERLIVGGRKQRELLSLLVLHRNRAVSASRLAGELWGDDAPRSAEVTLRSHVSHLRKSLGPLGNGDVLVTGPAGYSLALAPGQVDVERFEQLIGLGQEAVGLGRPQRAAEHIRAALRLWRGEPFADLADLDGVDAATGETARLEELRLGALEVLATAELAAGRHREVVGELEGLVAAYPFRERFCAQLMVALFRSGRQADALAAYASARTRLADELGLDPGPELQTLAERVLRQDPVLLGDADPAAYAIAVAPTSAPTPPNRGLPDAVLANEVRVALVGRSAEVGRLDQVWDQTVAGQQRLLLVSGEAGIGKTRLLATLAQKVEAAGCPVLVGRSEANAPPYAPIRAAFAASAEVSALFAAAPAAVRSELEPLLDPSIRAAERPPAPASAGEESFHAAVAFILGRLTSTGPALLLLDNAENLDGASSVLLRNAVTRLPAGLLIAVAYRDPPGSRHPPLLDLIGAASAGGRVDRVALGPLGEDEIDELVRGILPSADAGMSHRLWEQSGGNPFFAREAARSLADQTAAASRSPADPDRWTVPAGVRDAIRHRLRALPPPAPDVLPVAAVLGAEVDFLLLTQVLSLPEEDVAAALDAAVSAGLLVESGQAWTGSYTFGNQLLRESLAGEIGGLQLRSLHLRAARARMAAPHLGAGGSAAIATHLRAAGTTADPFLAAEWSERAAQDASRVYAWEEAIAHADAAIVLLEVAAAPSRQAEASVRAALLRLKSNRELPRAVEQLQDALRRYLSAGDEPAAGLTHSRLGGALCTHHSVMDIPRALEHFSAAERLTPGSETVFHLHRGRSQAAMFGLRTPLLRQAADRAAAIASAAGRRDLAVVAGWAQGWAAVNQGRLSDAEAIWASTWTIAHESADPYLGWIAVNAAALVHNAYLEDPRTARQWCRRGLGQPQFSSFDHPHGAVVDQLALALAASGELTQAREVADTLAPDAVARRMLHFLNGRWEQAAESWAAAAVTDEAAGDLHDAGLNLRWLAMARRRLGLDLGSVVAPLERAVTFASDQLQVPTELAARAELAELLAFTRPVEARDHLARCELVLTGGQNWRGLLGQVELARAAVAAADGDDAAGDDAFIRALGVFDDFGLPWRAAAARQLWAHRLRERDRRDSADLQQQLAQQIYAAVGAPDRWLGEPGLP